MRSQSISWRNEPERLQTMMHNLLLKPSKNLVKTICLVKNFEPEINFPAHEVNKHLHVLPLTHKWRKSSSILTPNFVTGALGFPPVQIVGSMTLFYCHTLSCHTDVPVILHHQTLVLEILDAMVHPDCLPECDIPVPEETPFTLAVNKSCFLLGEPVMVSCSQI